MAFEVTPLSLEEIKQYATKDAIWVINHTDLGRQQSRGDFYLEIVDSQNIAHPIKLPDTWLAINLAMFAQSTDIVRSQNFITAVRKGLLIAVSPDEAKQVNTRPGADVEQAKVAELNQSLGAINLNTGKVSISTGGGSAVASAPATPSRQTANTGTDKELRALVTQFNQNAISEDDAIRALDAFNPPPSGDAFKDATEMVNMKSSPLYRALAERISDVEPAPLRETA